MTYVTCPTMRYHPAVVAQKAATLQLLADGRFTLGLGSGENLNEHVVGEGWPSGRTSARRCSRRRSRSSASCTPASSSTHAGEYFDGRLRADLGPARPGASPSRVAVCGERLGRAVRPAGRPPDRRRAEGRRSSHGLERHRRRAAASATRRAPSGRSRSAGTPTRTPPCERAHEQFRWFGGGWAVNADLPTTAGFAGATQFVRPEDVADSIPCGPDLDAIVEAVRAVLGGRLHRHRPRADRRRRAGPVPRRGGRAAAREAARAPQAEVSRRRSARCQTLG